MRHIRKVNLAGAAFFTMASLAAGGCSVKTYAINMVGNALASGDSVYETDDDLDLVGQALPFGLKLTESLLSQSPQHRGLLLTACRGFTLYSYAYIEYEASTISEVDLDRARALRVRARRMYLRAFGYCIRGLEQSHPGFGAALLANPRMATTRITQREKEATVPLLYWAAASLGLAVSTAPGDASLLARLPDVNALLDRALELDETWQQGSLHEFKVVLAGAVPGEPNVDEIRRHYERAVALSAGNSASIHLAYAEATAVPRQDAAAFRRLVQQALDVDIDLEPTHRLANLIARRRAEWLLGRVDELILTPVVLEPDRSAK
jgi:predicted anti-sigma-YlaC factor YlaD